MANAGVPGREMRVVLATDGSPEARAAGEWLGHFPLPASTRVLVVAVATLPPSPLDIPTVREFYETLREEARRAAEDSATPLALRLERTETRVVEGDPREVLVRVAREWDADLLVVGARGLGVVKRFLLGSVSTAVLHHAPCSVLVARGTPGILRKVLVAIDASAHSLVAARFMASLPLSPALGVRLLSVVEPPRFPVPGAGMLAVTAREVLDGWTPTRKRELGETLRRLEPEFRGKVASVDWSVEVGPPAQTIIDAASEPGVDLVVVGARGLGSVERLLIGSVSERVVHQVDRPVLVVRSARAL
jgi:nucleotide-binding universal stress UspA family protein